MHRTEKPSARFLGLLHGQAVIRGDSKALSMIEARAHERGLMPAVARHSSAYIVRRFSLDWMQAHDHTPEEAPAAKVRRDRIEAADHPILRVMRGSAAAAFQSRH
jgi:hypothetical protein